MLPRRLLVTMKAIYYLMMLPRDDAAASRRRPRTLLARQPARATPARYDATTRAYTALPGHFTAYSAFLIDIGTRSNPARPMKAPAVYLPLYRCHYAMLFIDTHAATASAFECNA